MKNFCFTIDDNIRFLKELNEIRPKSIFCHPYLNSLKNLNQKYGVKVQLNLFYELNDFNLSQMTDIYKNEFQENSSWLKFSFHSKLENVKPYKSSSYAEVFNDCNAVNCEILRFAGAYSLAKTTTIHYCLLTDKGVKAVNDCGYVGLLGLYGDEENKRTSYQNTDKESELLRIGEITFRDGVYYASIDVILNLYTIEEILEKLQCLTQREFVRVMIHEQYFYKDYFLYQKDFFLKLDKTFEFLTLNGYKSTFFENKI